tara:strand:+ start:74 stop:577 length:504 start_codon:yes stop_codon:yes gene_type:complete
MTENAQEKRSDEDGQTDPAPFSEASVVEVTSGDAKTDPIEVLDQLEGLVKGVDEMKESLMSGVTKHSEPTSGTGPSLGDAEDISAKHQPEKSEAQIRQEQAEAAEMQKLVHFCNSMNLYQKARLVSFLSREAVLLDTASNQVLPLVKCDIVIDGVTIVIKLPSGEKK